MDLSIIIISHNTEKLLSLCLTSVYATLTKTDISFETIVVDNASSDGSVMMVQKKFPGVILLRNAKNEGFGKANNRGIRKSSGDVMLLLNSDTQVTPGAIESLYDFVRAHANSFVGPKLINTDTSDQTSSGPFFSLPVVFATLFLKGDVLGLTRWSPHAEKKVDWVSGACLMASRKTFLDGLLFDEGIFMYMDEIDLLYRAKKKGYTVFFYPKARVIHVGSGSSPDKRKTPILNIYKGLQLFYKKHHPGWREAVLKGMLQCKALLGIFVGTVTGNRELKHTYEEAIRMVE